MEAKKATISASAAKLDKLLNGLPDIKSSKTFKQKQKNCLSHVQTVESCINSMMDPKEPEFKRTMNYIDLKSKASMLRIKEKQKEKEKLDKIEKLFTHSSKNSYEFIHPDMLKDQIVKKVLRKNKRSFGGFEERSNFRDIKPCIVNQNILYNNTYRHSLKFNNNRIIKNLEVKTPISHATSPKNEERLVTIKGDKEVDLHLKELIQQSMLEFGELKLKLARCLIYKVKNI